ncbi:MAG TPA: hypothetical protein VIG08_03005 [Gemmatimonadales bacterium]|jgi:hypothetical protein
MLELKKNAAIGMVLGALLVGGTTVQASAQATQDTSKATSQDTSAYSAPSRSDTSAPAGAIDTTAIDTTVKSDSSKMGHDSVWTDTSKAGKKAWKKNSESDSTTAK